MGHAFKIFTRKIVWGHAALLVVVLAAVTLGARQVYQTARHQALQQASERQELLASQTARGIERYYGEIVDDLDLLRNAEAATIAPRSHSDASFSPLQPGAGFSYYVWHQLSSKAIAVFVFDLTAQNPKSPMRMLQSRDKPFHDDDADRLVAEVSVLAGRWRTWMQSLNAPGVSQFTPIAPGSQLSKLGVSGGVNLVCLPLSDSSGRLLVGVVPGGNISSQFLPRHTDGHLIGTTLLDENLMVIASTTPVLTPAQTGGSLKEIDDPAMRLLTTQFITENQERTRAFEQPVTVAGNVLPPRLMTAEPVNVPGANWCLLVLSPLSDVDMVVSDLFQTVVYWALFLSVAMSAILVSTTVRMIRSQARMETARHQVLTRELDQARNIQLSWLPDHFSANRALDVAAVNQPASHISGDFYNWFELPDGRRVFIIGDVSGHGIAGAFLMAATQIIVRSSMLLFGDAGACMEEVNQQLCNLTFHGQFVTLLVLVVDESQGIVKIASAGHAPPLYREDGGFFNELPMRSDCVLGVDERQTYSVHTFNFTPRSTFVLYTDGVVEMPAISGERFDLSRFISCLNGVNGSAQQVIERVLGTLGEFRGARELDDDLTMVTIRNQPVTLAEGADASKPQPATVSALI